MSNVKFGNELHLYRVSGFMDDEGPVQVDLKAESEIYAQMKALDEQNFDIVTSVVKI